MATNMDKYAAISAGRGIESAILCGRMTKRQADRFVGSPSGCTDRRVVSYERVSEQSGADIHGRRVMGMGPQADGHGEPQRVWGLAAYRSGPGTYYSAYVTLRGDHAIITYGSTFVHIELDPTHTHPGKHPNLCVDASILGFDASRGTSPIAWVRLMRIPMSGKEHPVTLVQHFLRHGTIFSDQLAGCVGQPTLCENGTVAFLAKHGRDGYRARFCDQHGNWSDGICNHPIHPSSPLAHPEQIYGTGEDDFYAAFRISTDNMDIVRCQGEKATRIGLGLESAVMVRTDRGMRLPHSATTFSRPFDHALTINQLTADGMRIERDETFSKTPSFTELPYASGYQEIPGGHVAFDGRNVHGHLVKLVDGVSQGHFAFQSVSQLFCEGDHWYFYGATYEGIYKVEVLLDKLTPMRTV